MKKIRNSPFFSSPVFDCLQNGDPWSVSGPQLGLLHQRHDHEPQSPEGRVSRVRGRNGGHCRPHAQTHQEVRRPFFLSDSVPLSVTSLEPRVQSVRFHSLPRLLRVPLPRNSLVASWPADGLPFPTSCFCDRLARMCAVASTAGLERQFRTLRLTYGMLRTNLGVEKAGKVGFLFRVLRA